MPRPFLARAHLVDGLFPRNAQALSPQQAVRHFEILLRGDIRIGFPEGMPGVPAFQQPVGQELLPVLLADQALEDAFHAR